MVTVLLAQELGLGRWHAGLLGAIADAITRLAPDARVHFALPDVVTGASALGRPAAILAAPHHMPAASLRHAGPTRSFADVLADAGWADPHTLQALVASWHALLDLTRPDVVVADHAPTLLLAARVRGLPTLAVGLGFGQPPSASSTFPSLLPRGAPPFDAPSIEAPLLAHARMIVTDLATLPDALRATRACVTCLDALDPYRDQRRRPTLGVVEPVPPPLPTPEGPLLAYLSAEDPRSLPLLAALASAGHAVRAYLRDASSTLLEALRREPGASLLDLSPRPLAMAKALRAAPLVVHHGGAGTIHQAVAAGRPQLLLPRYLEQAMNAQVLVGRGVAALAPPDPSDTGAVAELVAELLHGPAPKTAQAWARLVEAERDPDAAMTLAREALALA